jgi:hypothetical protein
MQLPARTPSLRISSNTTTPYDPSEPYSREQFAVDVSEGKTDPIYKAHSYHTKAPHLAIVPSILHYTEPGDVEKGYLVFHDIVGNGFNIDHVLVGPTGVYTVDTKTISKPARGACEVVYYGEKVTVSGFTPDRNPAVQA